MKKAAWLAVSCLMMCACGSEGEADRPLTPVAEEPSAGLAMVHPTLVCSEGTCSGAQAMDPVRSQQALSGVSYSTYLGFAGGDGATAVTVDQWGNAYVLGFTTLGDTTRSNGSYRRFVAKMSPAGQVIYYTYFDQGIGALTSSSIAVDGTGNAYIVGGDLNVSFLAKLNASGSAFLYYNLMPAGVILYDIALDSAGNAYVVGSRPQSSNPAAHDVYVAKVNSSGSAFLYGVTFGGAAGDAGLSIAIDGSGNAYVTGQTRSSNFPVWNAYQSALWGSGSAFVAKLNATGTGLLYSTYLGGTNSAAETFGRGIAVDASGNAYVTGQTNSSFFPVTAGALQGSFGGGAGVAYLTKLSTTGGLVYSTYLGGNQGAIGMDVVVDRSSGSAYVVGTTTSPVFPVTGNAFQPWLGGHQDVFVTQVSPSGGALLYSSYLGGNDNESLGASTSLTAGIALDSSKNLYVAGGTFSTNFPTNVYGYAGDQDAFITKFREP
jgi:hypothetical protein